MKTLKHFFIFVATTIFLKVSAQNNNYRAVHWNIEDGLTQGVVSCFLKDVNGFLWMGTQWGVSRFDGSTFKNYFADKNNNKTIIDNDIVGLVEDSLHNIWIGSSYGLCRYDIKADTFSKFLPSAVHSESNNSIIPFSATNDQILCFESGSRFISFDMRSLTKKTLLQLAPNDNILGNGWPKMNTIYYPRENSVWMIESVDGYLLPYGALREISLSNGKTKHYRWPCYRKIPNHSHTSEGMRYDAKRNCIWINSNDGLLQFTLVDKKFHHVDALDTLQDIKDYEKNFHNAHWCGIDIDQQDRIWLASVEKGIVVYDPFTGIASQPFSSDNDIANQISNRNGRIYCDRDGIVWLSFWIKNGFYQLLPFSVAVKRYTADTTIPHSLSSDWVFNCLNADHGKVWIGTDGGLNIFDPLTHTFRVLTEKDLPGIEGNRIVPAAIDTIGQRAWLRTQDKVYEMDIKTKKCQPIIFKDANNNTISNIEISSPYYGYWASYKNACIIPADYGEHFGIFITDSNGIEAHEVLTFRRGEIDEVNGHIAIIAHDQFLLLQKLGSTTIYTYLNSNDKWKRIFTPLDSMQIQSIVYEQRTQTYWAVGEGQLIHYDKEFKIIHRYTKKDGLPELEIYSVIPDNDENIWFNTDRSICKLDTKTGKIKTLTSIDGFERQTFTSFTNGIKDFYGNLYFQGGMYGKGLNIVNPSEFRETYPPSTVYIRSLEVNEKPFISLNNASYTDKISLRYFENNISIETGIIDYYSKGKSDIRYKLEGVNNNWQYAPANYTIRYDGLQPKKYKLLLQASNAANNFNGPVKSIIIQIYPPFWNTWWFRSIIVVCFVLLIYGLIRWRLHQKFQQQLEHSEKEKQLAEMGQKTTELEMQALRAQMNPHFIFNCLNSINRFILSNNAPKAADYLTKFAKLIRIVLQQSGKSFIPLEDELYCLKLYMDLEALRFETPFEYEINCNGVNTSSIMTPSLLIQPFVENAIWHGLQGKNNGNGKIDISVSLQDNILHCKICDNGIGRMNSSASKKSIDFSKKSLGMKLTQNRLELVDPLMKEEVGIVISDLTDADGQDAGTCVHVKIPVKII